MRDSSNSQEISLILHDPVIGPTHIGNSYKMMTTPEYSVTVYSMTCSASYLALSAIVRRCLIYYCLDERRYSYFHIYDFILQLSKGYEGCRNVYFMKKRRKGEAHLRRGDKDYNDTISANRVEVEQFFGSIKDWRVINHVFRGDLESHSDIFSCCLILTQLSKLWAFEFDFYLRSHLSFPPK
jgi:hypothetical protein